MNQEPFFINLGNVFDLLNFQPVPGLDGFVGEDPDNNVLKCKSIGTIALEVGIGIGICPTHSYSRMCMHLQCISAFCMSDVQRHPVLINLNRSTRAACLLMGRYLRTLIFPHSSLWKYLRNKQPHVAWISWLVVCTTNLIPRKSLESGLECANLSTTETAIMFLENKFLA